jgi:hypothetical protein
LHLRGINAAPNPGATMQAAGIRFCFAGTWPFSPLFRFRMIAASERPAGKPHDLWSRGERWQPGRTTGGHRAGGDCRASGKSLASVRNCRFCRKSSLGEGATAQRECADDGTRGSAGATRGAPRRSGEKCGLRLPLSCFRLRDHRFTVRGRSPRAVASGPSTGRAAPKRTPVAPCL